MKRDYCVYCHTLPSGRRYIGISNNPVRRWGKGRGYAKNYLFARAIEKYGWDNIQHEILFKNLRVETAQLIERNLIEEMELTDHSRGLNLREGGDGAFSEHSRQLMSKARKGNNNCVGRVLSDETKARISNSLKKYYEAHKVEKPPKIKVTRPKKEPRKRIRPWVTPIKQMTLDGTVIRTFAKLSDASKELNIDASTISKCCKGKIKTYHGYRWEYL